MSRKKKNVFVFTEINSRTKKCKKVLCVCVFICNSVNRFLVSCLYAYIFCSLVFFFFFFLEESQFVITQYTFTF